MDVRCTTCGEPWDFYHLRHEAIHETGVPEEIRTGWDGKLTPYVRAEFKVVGYEFGRTVMNVIGCPGCPKDLSPDPEKLAIKAELENLMGGDLDGLAATYEDHGL